MPEVGGAPAQRAPTRGCSGTSARSPTSARSRSASTRASACGSSDFLHERRRHPDRLARGPDRAHRSNRRRHRRAVEAAGVYPHMDLCRPAPWLDRRRGPLAGRNPCGRRPPVGCAARAADPAFRRPAHLGSDAAVEAEGEPGGHGDRKRRGHDRRPVRRPARGVRLPPRSLGRRRPGANAARGRRSPRSPRRCRSGPTSSTTRPTPRSTSPSRAA